MCPFEETFIRHTNQSVISVNDDTQHNIQISDICHLIHFSFLFQSEDWWKKHINYVFCRHCKMGKSSAMPKKKKHKNLKTDE